MKKGILMVSFGTTYRETREKNIDKIETAVRDAYPDCLIRQAYSSDRVRAAVYKTEGILIPGIEEALKQMKVEGIRQITVLPTHIINGFENHKMKQIIEAYRDSFQSLQTAGALLEREEDYREAACAFWDSIKDKTQGKTLILMGHGTSHEADKSYEKLEAALRDYAKCDIFIATVEGKKTIEDVIKELKKRTKASLLIMPFMLTAGDHANHDMAGDEDSFLSKVRAEGYETCCLIKGIGEYEKIREIYLRHLRKAYRD